MSREFEVYIEYARELEKFFGDLRSVLLSIKRDVEQVAPGARVYLFGSVARGEHTYASDVDVLVVLESLSDVDVDSLKARIKTKYRGCPIELHVVDRREFEGWYRRFIRPGELLEIA